MTDRNPYSQYSYDNFDQKPRPRGKASGTGKGLKERMSHPVFATAALLLTAAVFTGIVLASYPRKTVDSEAIPLIKADLGEIRTQPEARGGMEIPYQDSTVFSNIRASELQETPPVENLAEQEEPLQKLEAFAKEAGAMYENGEVGEKTASGIVAAPVEITETAEADTDSAAGPVAPDVTASPAIKHPAASSPETLAFVRSVLDEKDSKASEALAAEKLADAKTAETIEPAAGAASAMKPIAPGSYYVQLGSVTSESGAAGEWAKLQKSFGTSLQQAAYRVQKADLGERGVRYRIQAGPMSKDSAANICESIKAQKPGGCIVVQ